MEELYGNVGGKIKTFAFIIFIIEALASIIFGIANMVTDDILNMGDEVGIIVGLLCIVLGPILSFVSSLTLYGFGELVEHASFLKEKNKNTAYINQTLIDIKKELENINKNTLKAKENTQPIRHEQKANTSQSLEKTNDDTSKIASKAATTTTKNTNIDKSNEAISALFPHLSNKK